MYVRIVRVKITCPNLREENSSCGPYKFTYNIAYAPAGRSSGSCTALCAQRTKQPKLGARYSNSRGMGLLKRWVVVRVACLPWPVQP